MKIAFDECLPAPMTRVFKSLSTETQIRRLTGFVPFEIVGAVDFTPRKGDHDYLPRNDVPWLRRFAEAGGQVVISGNTRMQTVAHERLALKKLGLITVFFEARWNSLKFFHKSALMLHWWPVILRDIQVAQPGAFLGVPRDWNLDGRLRTLDPITGVMTRTYRAKLREARSE